MVLLLAVTGKLRVVSNYVITLTDEHSTRSALARRTRKKGVAWKRLRMYRATGQLCGAKRVMEMMLFVTGTRRDVSNFAVKLTDELSA